jgi:hypothetical protein
MPRARVATRAVADVASMALVRARARAGDARARASVRGRLSRRFFIFRRR